MQRRIETFVRGKRCVIASADQDWVPHVTTGEVEELRQGVLTVAGWFCPQTLANLEAAAPVAIVVRGRHRGYQFVGTVSSATVEALLDGYSPEEVPDVPQVKYRVVVSVGQTLAMTDLPHTDTALAV